ncbi:MAG: hypothetical protein H7338_09450 [Candidatus Sericytochromatia bacterium]|nr:hypothetical protein [Candidatus Sericytochromatia bacterium]
MFQHYVLIRNPYARTNVFRCSGPCPHASADGTVSAFAVLTQSGCFPRGCSSDAAPRLLLSIDQYAKFEQELDQYDYTLNLLFGTQVTLSGTIKAIETRMNRYVPTILNGYMLQLEMVAVTEHVRFAEIWLYLSSDEFDRYDLQPGDRLTAEGRFFVNTQDVHRVEIKRVTRLVVFRPVGRWQRLLESARSVAEALRLPIKGHTRGGWTRFRV